MPKRNMKAYMEALKLYSQIKEWCSKNEIKDFDLMMERLKTDKPEWYDKISCRPNALTYFLNYFNRLNQYNYVTEERKQGRIKNRGDIPHKGKAAPCICVETSKEFPSFRQAGIWLGVDGTAISDCCYGVRDSIKGYHFKLAEKDEKK